jgi:hypothetical protein
MHPEIQNSAQEIDTADWKEIPILPDPRAACEKALSNPAGCRPLAEIIRTKGKPAAGQTS